MTTTALPPVLDPETEDAAQQTAWMSVLPRLLRVWGIRSVLSIVDQGLTASVGFGVNVLLARWMPADVYGAFAVAFAGFLVVSGFHNAVLLEPLTVLGPARHAKQLFAYFREQLAVHALLVGALSAIILVTGGLLSRITPQSPLPGALLGSGIALPFLLLLWLVRRMCYVLQRPSAAVFGSIFYLGFVLGGLWLLNRFHHVSPFTAFLLTGTGSLLSAGLLWSRIASARPEDDSAEREVSWREVLRENWTYGRWLVGSTALNSVSGQAQMFLVAGTVGLGAAGVLRAMQIPALVMVQIIAATGLLVLPAFSYDFGVGSIARMRHKANLVSISLVGATLSFAVVLGLFAGRTEQLLFGGKYAGHAWLIPILALVPVALSASMGHSMALRASQRPHFDLVANAIAAPVAIISALVFMHWWGLPGAAVSVVLSYVTCSITTCWVYRASAGGEEKRRIRRTKSPIETPVPVASGANGNSNRIGHRGRSPLSARPGHVKCLACGSLATHHFSLPHTSVWECSDSKCALQFANPQLEEHKLNQAYESLYYPVGQNRNGVHFENTSESVLRQVFSKFEQRFGRLAGLRLLDYGCGVGSLLRVSTEFGMRPTGIEPDAQARSTMASVRDATLYQNLEELSAAEPGKRFDMIVLWTVIEHLRRPWEDLARLRLLLEPHGSLLISTINIRSLRARIERQRWQQYRNPTHFYYFDRASLPRVIERAGFSDVSEWRLRIRYPHHGALRRSLHYANSVAGLADGLFYLCRNGRTEKLNHSSLLTAPEQSGVRQNRNGK
jgi:O-antigen/teichoic acid export membrane protein/cyclopropane fatty-acyl-phospholipid synthase-like methyltransferase